MFLKSESVPNVRREHEHKNKNRVQHLIEIIKWKEMIEVKRLILLK